MSSRHCTKFITFLALCPTLCCGLTGPLSHTSSPRVNGADFHPPIHQHQRSVCSRRNRVCLTTATNDKYGDEKPTPFRWPECIIAAKDKFTARPSVYLLIPVVAAFVGWFTNYLAVQMIFYPIHFKGLNIWRTEEVPLGLLGWQGIVPCKTRTMSESMVKMVSSELLNIKEVFRRLNPLYVAGVLNTEVPSLGKALIKEQGLPSWSQRLTSPLLFSLPGRTLSMMDNANQMFLKELAIGMQDNIESLLNVKNCVIDQMLQDRSLLGILFRKCGQAELDFLTNSGLWFGFLLGLIQMVIALFYDSPWTMSIGGTIVGLATNWLALKWIFEPVNPTKVGPFTFQGLFLTRQREVAGAFSSFFASNVLTSRKLWGSILSDPSTNLTFDLLFGKNLQRLVLMISGGFGISPGVRLLGKLARQASAKLPNHLHVLHPYVDNTLALRGTLETEMKLMTSLKFERVLHPIFEEDELTLIIAGGFLGLLAGLVQQGIETGNVKNWFKWSKNYCMRLPMRIKKKIGRFGSTS